MEKTTIDNFMITFSKYFSSDKLLFIRNKLEDINDDQMKALTVLSNEFKDPTISLIVSIFLGGWGIDRFLIGDIGMGLFKLLTMGVFGFLYFIDIFLIMGRTKEKNFDKIIEIFSKPSSKNDHTNVAKEKYDQVKQLPNDYKDTDIK